MSVSYITAKYAGLIFTFIVFIMSILEKYWFFKLWFIPTCKVKLLIGSFSNNIYKLNPGELPPMYVLIIELAAIFGVVILALKIRSHCLEQFDYAILKEEGI